MYHVGAGVGMPPVTPSPACEDLLMTYSPAFRSLRGCASTFLVGMTLAMFVFTGFIFRMWLVATAGVWATGRVVAISRCLDRHGHVLPSAELTLAYTDQKGVRHRGQTNCEDLRYEVGQSLPVRYLPSDPSYVLLKDDIDGGLGGVLIGFAACDVVLSSIVTVGAVVRIRASRRARSGRQRAASATLGVPLRGLLVRSPRLRALTLRQRHTFERDSHQRPRQE